jgi:flagellar hook-associated protein 3 FlgL
MTRISSYNQFFGSAAGISSGQTNMAKAQAQAATQKVATDLKGYGQQTGRLLSSKSYADRLDRRAETLSALQGRADVEAAALSGATEAVKFARDSIGNAVASGNAAGLRTAMEQVVATLGSAANAQYGGQAVFGGNWGYGDPFVVTSLDDLAIAGVAGADAFWVDTGENRRVMIDDNREIQLSDGAESIFRPLIDFITQIRVWENNNTALTGKMSDTQAAFVMSLMPNIANLQAGLIDQEANAGLTAKQIENTALSNKDQRDTLTKTIGDQENVDLAEVATRLAAAQTQYQTSASIFGQMRDMNLLQYLR